MTMQDWLMLITLGAVLGATGQGVRVVVGLKKLWDEAEKTAKPISETFSTIRLFSSLFLGAIVGALSAFALDTQVTTTTEIGREVVLTIVAAGYAGGDALEGLMNRFKLA